ncbi:MAG: hypothetical protein HYX27_02500 [Acidobacteria bacterium]|nr:hypothetical protein [Acidobacteriota bacterium]
MGYVVCGACSARIPPTNWNQEFPLPCPMCSREVWVTVFPVALHPPKAGLPEQVVTGQEASCYNHVNNRAVAACDDCGRFLCALCDVDAVGGHVCPACFERRESPALHERVNYDSIALALVTLPMLLCWLPVFTTPAALFFAFKFWNAPALVMPRSKWRLWLTLLIAILQIAVVIWFFAAVVPGSRGGALPKE